jgi:hypothetical protein
MSEIIEVDWKGRHEFAQRLNEEGLLGDGKCLRCVDPYLGGYSDLDPVSDRDRREDREEAFRVLVDYLTAQTCRLYLCTSAEAARFFEGAQFDFVYIDADHGYEHAKDDLRMWWPLVKSGGLLAGHDWDIPGDRTFPWRHTVQRAVTEFADQHNQTIYVVDEPSNGVQSYYLVKP